jgi:DNA modification methylase
MYQIVEGNSLEKLRDLADRSVHCVVTSPPYWPQLRNYGGRAVKWADGWEGCLGDEPSPDLFCDHLCDIFREVRRVLRDDGTLWVNIGDSYAKDNSLKDSHGIKKKDLLGTPWLFAFAMRKDGWYLRNDCVWKKPNAMPDSTKDRCGRDHEYIFQFTKSESYYFDLLSVREKASDVSLKRIAQKSFDTQKGGEKDYGKNNINASRSARKTIENFAKNPGRNKRTVWEIPTANLREGHFAAYPEKIPFFCIKMSTSEHGCCKDCGMPYGRVVESTRIPTRPGNKNKQDETKKSNRDPLRHISLMETKGWQKSCDCDTQEIVPATVLDPFNGAGTTGVASEGLSRDYIGIELFPDYVEITRKRMKKLDPIFSQEKKS